MKHLNKEEPVQRRRLNLVNHLHFIRSPFSDIYSHVVAMFMNSNIKNQTEELFFFCLITDG